VSVPAPIFVSPPAPEMPPASVALLPFVSNVPPPLFSVTARLVVKPDRNCKVPPAKARPPELLPRLPSLDTASVPALIVVPPRYVLLADSVSVPAPIFVSPPVPEIVPESPSELLCVSTVSVPLSVIALASERPLAAACSVVPLAKVLARRCR
jgi:hypothetical protein